MSLNPLGNKKLFLVIILVASTVLFLVWMARDTFTTNGPLTRFRSTDRFDLIDKLLLIRRVSPEGNLLLKILNEEPVYEYDIAGNRVSIADRGIWASSTQRVIVCDQSIGISPRTNSKYDPYGKYALSAAESPSQEKVAVVSAYGPQSPLGGLIFGLGGEGRIFGTRYLEIKNNSDSYQTLGKPWRLDEDDPALCWSDDGNLLVAYDPRVYVFSVVNLGPIPAALEAIRGPMPSSSMPDLSRLTGSIRDYGVDEDHDGLFEKVAIDVGTETSVPGDYEIFVGLKSKNGKYFGESVDTKLNGGIESTKLFFDTNKWFDAKAEGPFQIDAVQLYYRKNPMLEMLENAGLTQAYRLSQFARPSIIFTGNSKVVPVDRNKNGKFEELEFYVGVDVLSAGNYSYSGDLYDDFQNPRLVDGVRGGVHLQKGENFIKFIFSGQNIIKHNVSGRYRLRFVYLGKDGVSSPMLDEVVKTDPYDISQFESGH